MPRFQFGTIGALEHCVHNGNSAQAVEVFGTYNHHDHDQVHTMRFRMLLCSTISGWDDGNSAQAAVGSDAEIGPDEF